MDDGRPRHGIKNEEELLRRNSGIVRNCTRWLHRNAETKINFLCFHPIINILIRCLKYSTFRNLSHNYQIHYACYRVRRTCWIFGYISCLQDIPFYFFVFFKCNNTCMQFLYSALSQTNSNYNSIKYCFLYFPVHANTYSTPQHSIQLGYTVTARHHGWSIYNTFLYMYLPGLRLIELSTFQVGILLRGTR